MDEPNSQQEEPGERTVTPAEVWEQLSPDVQERACRLLRRMAYKYALKQCGSLSEETGVRGEIQGDESKDHK